VSRGILRGLSRVSASIKAEECQSGLTILIRLNVRNSEPPQLGIKALSAETEHLSGGSPIIASEFQGCLDTESFDNVGSLTYQLFQCNSADKLGELFD
jgi:hypothetical protein